MTIARSPIEATGGLTVTEKNLLAAHHTLWATRAARSNPINPEKILPLIKQLYSTSSLAEPSIKIVSSPGVMAFAGTFASHIFDGLMKDKNYRYSIPKLSTSNFQKKYEPIVREIIQSLSVMTADARNFSSVVNKSDIYHRILYATFSHGDHPTSNAMDRKTIMDIQNSLENYPLRDMKNAIVDAMKDPFGNSTMTSLLHSSVDEWGLHLANMIFPDKDEAQSAINSVCDWWKYSQSGSADTYWDFCITAARDILGINIPENEKYKIWEECTIESAYRYIHPAFCLVCDFPTQIVSKNLNYIDGSGQNNYIWSDGWSI